MWYNIFKRNLKIYYKNYLIIKIMNEILHEDRAHHSCNCSSKKDKSAMKWLFFIFLVLSLSAVVVVSILRDKIVNNFPNQVAVNGQGKVSYQPDIAHVVLGVQIDKVEKSEEALKMLNEKVNQIISNLLTLGIETKDIKNQTYSLYPFYDYVEGVNTQTGYNANQQIVVRVNGIDNNFNLLNKVIAESAKAGANQVLGVSFESSKIEELKQEARILAITDARSKATVLASAIGVTLGDTVGWWENTVSPSPYQDFSSYSGSGGAGGTPIINSGSYDVIVELGINYQIAK